MGKISDALEKAGREGEKDAKKVSKSIVVDNSQETPPISQASASLTTTKTPPEPVSLAQPVYMDDQPVAHEIWDERLFKAVNEDQFLPEIFKTLRSRILLPGDDKPVPKTIMVTSAEPKEGKSFITANLGVSLAQGLDQHCLLVSCDLRRPSLSYLFGLDSDYGLVDYLRDKKDLSGLIQKTSVDKLSIIASGKPPVNPAELLGSSRMKALVEELSRRYEDRIVIFDSPPYQLAAEAAVLAKLVDSVILVVRQGGAARHQAKKLVEKIGHERLLGVVFNAHTTNVVERSLMKGYGSYAAQSYS
jgi:protein-tyrosine kinase